MEKFAIYIGKKVILPLTDISVYAFYECKIYNPLPNLPLNDLSVSNQRNYPNMVSLHRRQISIECAKHIQKHPIGVQ